MTNSAWQQKPRRNYLDEGDTPDYGPFNDDEEVPIPGMAGVTPGTLRQLGVDPATGRPSLGESNGAQMPGQPAQELPPEKTPLQPVNESLDRLKSLINQRPVENKPNVWERLAAGAAGGLAGWSNAASRTRNPIDIHAAQSNILHPGYQDKLSRWQSQVIPASALADVEAKRAAAGLAQREEARKEALEGAQAGYYKAHGDYMEGLGRTSMVDVTPELSQAVNGIFHVGQKIPGTVASQVAAIVAGKYDPKTGKEPVTFKDKFDSLMQIPGMTQELATQAAINPSSVGKPEKPPPNLNEWQLYMDASEGDPKKALQLWRADKIGIARESRPERLDPDRTRPMRPALAMQIESRKNSRLNTLETQTQSRLKEAPALGLDPNTILAEQERQKQEIQNQYEGEIASATGAAPQHFDYKLDQPQQRPQQPVNQQQPLIRHSASNPNIVQHSFDGGKTWK